MSRRNALLEWLDQTKKLAKSKDYACLELVDRIFEILWCIDRRIIIRHRAIFDDVCTRYHKPNPADIVMDRRARKSILAGVKNPDIERRTIIKGIWSPPECLISGASKKCPLTGKGIALLNRFAEGSINSAEAAQKEILWQWFEIIDFMFERPELINPKSIDEYVEERINYVCTTHRKNNPLRNGVRSKFGKSWRDDDGEWHTERRRRF